MTLSGHSANCSDYRPALRRDMLNKLRLLLKPPSCGHLDLIREVTPRSAGCEECLAVGSNWTHLRLCLTCGYVGCCDSSPNRHATAHYRAVGHPVIASFEVGEYWRWCYEDELLIV